MANPSLAMIPSGYKDGTLYSPVPNTAVGDFDVSRGSMATRVNKEGLIETVGYTVGGEKVTNGDFATDSDWTKQESWDISGGSANYDFVTNGQYIRQTVLNGGFISGKSYKITFKISSGTAYLNIKSNGETFQVSDLYQIGSYSINITASTSASDLLIYGLNTQGSAFSIDNISVEEFAGKDVPRLDYTDGGCPVLLTEPQSTNLVSYSEDFSQGIWRKSNATVVSGFQSPSADGPLGAFKLVEDTSDLDHAVYQPSGSGNNEYSISVFAKKAERTKIRVNIGNDSHYVDFDLELGAVIATEGATTVGEIEALKNDWYRCSLSFTESLGAAVYTFIRLLDEAENSFYQGDGTSGVYIFGAQIEELPYVTSYIPTDDGTATRLGEEITGAGDSSTFNGSEGTLFGEMKSLETELPGSTYNYFASLSDGTSANRLEVRQSGTDFQFLWRVGGVFQDIITLTSAPFDSFIKFAISYSSTDIKFYLNGSLAGTILAPTLYSSGVLNNLEFADGAGNNNFRGQTSQVQVFKTALTDAELTLLTTI